MSILSKIAQTRNVYWTNVEDYSINKDSFQEE